MLTRLLLLALAGAAAFSLTPGAPPCAAPRAACSAISMAAGIRAGDNVVVISGDDKGTVGKVILVNKKKSQVTVEGVNMRTKHVKPQKEGETGRILKRETAVHISNVRLADADDDAEGEEDTE